MDQDTSSTQFGELPDELQSCIEGCLQCYETCEQTLAYCMDQGGGFARAEHLISLMSARTIAQTAAQFMIWKNKMASRVCGVCADVCLKCTESCKEFEPNPVLLHCANVCRQCAERCNRMATEH